MKMPEKHDLLAAIRGQRNKASGQSLRLQRVPSRRYNGGAFTKTVIDGNDVRHYRLPGRDRRQSGSNSCYIMSVFIGYNGTDSIGSLIKRFAAKKPEKM